jgi:hypothetical protein
MIPYALKLPVIEKGTKQYSDMMLSASAPFAAIMAFQTAVMDIGPALR